MNAIEMARKMETDAIAFYTEAADRTAYPAGKKMFETIAADEKKHLEAVNRLLEGLDIHDEDVHPMKNIRTVFEEMKDEMMERVKATSDELEAFRIAVRMEKEGVEFYRKLSSEAPTGKEKALFDKLLQAERLHYDIFENTYNFLRDTGNWFMWEEHSIVDGGTPSA
ncbi:MAG: ferritin family protein [Deferribacteres bacterium]|nr:ferritin family protein [Deferribacteres bacterium]